MTQEDKELLLKDLCARLPYAVTVEHKSGFRGTLHDVVVYHIYAEDDSVKDYVCTTNFFGEDDYIYIEYFKPYLLPMSSMTEMQLDKLKEITGLKYERNILELVEWTDTHKTLEFWLEEVPQYKVIEVFDWLNKNHFDYRGLIEKGLAIDATGKNIY